MSDTPDQIAAQSIPCNCGSGDTCLGYRTLRDGWVCKIADHERQAERIRKLEHESAELVLASDALILDLRERTGQRDRLAQANKELLEALDGLMRFDFADTTGELEQRQLVSSIVRARAALSKHGGTK